MSTARVVNVTRGVSLARNARVADTHWSRLRGLLGRPEPGPGQGLLLLPCRAVHMWGMRYALDVALGEDGGTVLAAYHGLRPWRATSVHPDASWALELPSGTLRGSGTTVGDEVRWEIVQEAPEPSTAEAARSKGTGGRRHER